MCEDADFGGVPIIACADHLGREREMLLVGCLTSQQHASVSQERICSDNINSGSSI